MAMGHRLFKAMPRCVTYRLLRGMNEIDKIYVAYAIYVAYVGKDREYSVGEIVMKHTETPQHI